MCFTINTHFRGIVSRKAVFVSPMWAILESTTFDFTFFSFFIWKSIKKISGVENFILMTIYLIFCSKNQYFQKLIDLPLKDKENLEKKILIPLIFWCSYRKLSFIVPGRLAKSWENYIRTPWKSWERLRK